MNCNEQQQHISALIDAEMSLEEAQSVFQHLAACEECRAFHHRLVALGNTLDRFAEAIPGGGITNSLPPRVPVSPAVQRWWSRRVSVGVPVVAFLLFILMVGIFLSVLQVYHLKQAETVYVTRFPAVVITSEGGRQ